MLCTFVTTVQHDGSWLVQARGRDAGGHTDVAVSVGDICGTDREQCGAHSAEGSETASGVSAVLGVDSAKRYHMRLVADKATYNKFKYRLSLKKKESAQEWAKLKASSTTTALHLEESVSKVLESGGKQRVSTKRTLINTGSTRCPRKMDVFHAHFNIGALEEMMRANTIAHKLDQNCRQTRSSRGQRACGS